ncbi:MAG: DUF177 domain-containing protein [Cyclobacteriaceae bacterium]|nr:DUF177 domain-containing protein [Cyclobacteriaceae bacterium]
MRGHDFRVNIIGLSQKEHRFEFTCGDAFFDLYGNTLLQHGDFKAEVTLDKRETLIEVRFHITGKAHLVCDRSLEPFDLLMTIDKTILFKYGEVEQELSDEIVLITRDQVSIDIGQYIYELIGVEVPIKKLHPRYQTDELEESDIQLVYSSPIEPSENEEEIDPRWEKLKKLK